MTMQMFQTVNELSGYKKVVIPYIAGYAVKITKKSLSCEECSAALTTGEIMNGSFFEKKNRGKLVRPTQDVIKVCEATEMCLQRLLKVTNGNLPQSFYLPHAIGSAVLGEIGQGQIFISLSDHMFDSTIRLQSHLLPHKEDSNIVFEDSNVLPCQACHRRY